MHCYLTKHTSPFLKSNFNINLKEWESFTENTGFRNCEHCSHYWPVLSHSQEHTETDCVYWVSLLGASVEQQLPAAEIYHLWVLSPDMHLRICNPQSSLPLFFPRVASNNRMSFGGLGPWMPTFMTAFRFRITSIYFIAVKLLCLLTPPEELISMQYPEEINDSKNLQNFVPFSCKQHFFGSHNSSPEKNCYYFPPLQMRKLSLKDFGKGPVLHSLHCEHKPVVAGIHTQAPQNKKTHYF